MMESSVSFKQSFAWWSFASDDEDEKLASEFLHAAAEIGYRGVDFLPPAFWPHARDAGIQLVIIDGHTPLEVGFNCRARHQELKEKVLRAIELAVVETVPFVAVTSGDKTPETDADGLASCVEALSPLAIEAHAAGVVLLVEPLNSKIDHAGHECDRTDWALKLIREVNSPGLKILYDFYHAQVMEGDLLRTVEKNLEHIAHFHTAGVPGRHDLDDFQEIHWPAVVRQLRSCGYTGFVAHEFIPRGDRVSALRAAFELFSE